MSTSPGEKIFLQAMTYYRLVPVMYALIDEHTNSNIKEIALKDLMQFCKAYSFKHTLNYEYVLQDILNFVHSNMHWIKYTMLDFAKYLPYSDVTYCSTMRMTHYQMRMLEQYSTTKHFPFNMAFNATNIVDIGCGPLPYTEELMACNAIDKYLAIDKEINIPRFDERFKDKKPALLQADFFKLMPSEEYNCYDTVFAAEFLHCVDKNDFMLQTKTVFPKHKRIIVIEPSWDSLLNVGFNMHMYKHTGTTVLDHEEIVKLGFLHGYTVLDRKVTKQHTAYIMERFI